MSEVNLASLDEHINSLIDAKIAALNVDSRIDSKVAVVDARVTAVDTRIDSRVDSLYNQIKDKLFNWAGTQIPANSNLDNYTTPGVYNVDANATVVTLANPPPSKSAFVLLVLPMSPYDTHSGTFQIQFAICFDGPMHTRYYQDWPTYGWTQWKTYQTTA